MTASEKQWEAITSTAAAQNPDYAEFHHVAGGEYCADELYAYGTDEWFRAAVNGYQSSKADGQWSQYR